MKVLKGTDAVIKGRFYKEGQSIPKDYEKDFSAYLVESETKSFTDDLEPNSSKPKTVDNKIKEKKRAKSK